MTRASRPRETVLLACPILRDLVRPRLAGKEIAEIYLDYGLHVQPRHMAAALQAQLDALSGPHTVLVGYGLCGTGLVGLEAGHHTLIVPRTHDCIAILLGSHHAYVRAQAERPGTYYLSRGWLESESHPLGHYSEYLRRLLDQESADYLIDSMYQSYTGIVFVASSQAELEECGPRAREVGSFCARRWGMSYEEQVGSPELVEQLLDAAANGRTPGEDFVVIPPGGRVELGMFMGG